MNDKTEQAVTDEPRGTAAGGHAEIINVPGYPLMVRAVDYNTLRADLDRAIVNFGDAAATVCDMRAQLAEAQKDAGRLDYIQKNARCDPQMDGNHVWWPTSLNKTLRGPTIRAAIDAAKGESIE